MIDALQAQDALAQLLGPELAQITDVVRLGIGPNNPYFVEIPETASVDYSVELLRSLVARSSNTYGRAERFAGMARAQAKLTKGVFDRRYKRSRHGRNDAEREEAAMEACQQEHAAWTLAEAVADLAESLANGARISSESARKLLSSVEQQQRASARETAGAFRDEDFRPY